LRQAGLCRPEKEHRHESEEYDRTEKFEVYRQLPSLVEYVLVSQDEPRIEVRRRGDDGRWTESIHAGSTEAGMDAVVSAAGLGVELHSAQVYAKVDWL
jgi:Uma2 family endonuclease